MPEEEKADVQSQSAIRGGEIGISYVDGNGHEIFISSRTHRSLNGCISEEQLLEFLNHYRHSSPIGRTPTLEVWHGVPETGFDALWSQTRNGNCR